MSTSRYELLQSKMTNFTPKLLYFTKSKYGEDWRSTPHYHPFTEIIFVVKGLGQLIVNDNQYELKKGDLFIIAENNLHTEKSTAKGALEYIIIGMDNVSLKAIKKNNGYAYEQNDVRVFSLEAYIREVMGYIDAIHKEIISKKFGCEIIINCILTQFLIFVMRNTDTSITAASCDVTIENRECAFIKNYIDCNFAAEISLSQLASKVFISKYHLSHNFKKFIGVSPIQYTISKRLHESQTLLKTTDMTITDIARCVGFSSPARFTEKFKSAFAMSPSMYRKVERHLL